MTTLLADATFTLTWSNGIILALIGLGAGLLGGLLGVGGSVIMIPGVTMLLGPNQHVYQAAAMIANIAVAVPATLRHKKANAILMPVVKWMIPVALVFVVLGVWTSNLPVFAGSNGGLWLGRILAVFLVYEVFSNIQKIVHPLTEHHRIEDAKISPPIAGFVGSLMGAVGGLLGVGGGVIAVPLQQKFLKLPLRNCIANSAAVMVFSSCLGAAYKNATLPQHDHTMTDGLLLAAVLAPTCWIGGHFGARLTHALPIRHVRGVFVVVMAVFAWKMAALPWP